MGYKDYFPKNYRNYVFNSFYLLSALNTLPATVTTGALVPHDDSFLIIGGHDGRERVDTIYYYEVDSELWLELDATLPRPTASLRAVKADINIFPSC